MRQSLPFTQQLLVALDETSKLRILLQRDKLHGQDEEAIVGRAGSFARGRVLGRGIVSLSIVRERSIEPGENRASGSEQKLSARSDVRESDAAGFAGINDEPRLHTQRH